MAHKRNAETGVVKDIKAALELAGYLVRRVQSGKVQVRHGWMQLAEKGTSDLVVQGPFFCGWMEVKLPGESATADQITFGNDISKRGGLYAVVDSPDDALSVARMWSVRANLIGAA